MSKISRTKKAEKKRGEKRNNGVAVQMSGQGGAKPNSNGCVSVLRNILLVPHVNKCSYTVLHM